ncbi:ATPase AAA [Micromonospora fulviviridis]|uniref:AAA family ATPase n=1 Tax=Micromonospora fulviviridis TaxID=47860 RepID=UPI00166DEEB9|nr:MoxR family ATPase [Micromonospora fulviviridis]GGR93347.1 ATPase AAA [Micromonospora fulviviridis]
MSTDQAAPTDADLTGALDILDNLRDSPTPAPARLGDSRSGDVYLVTDEIVTALKVALLTGRPLLLGGPPGCGKSSLASYVARNLGVAYYEFVTTDDSRPADLTSRLDNVRRLGDAQAQRLAEGPGMASIAPYLEPGPLWWALNPDSAAARGLQETPGHESDLEPARPPVRLVDHKPANAGAVLLIDEIDKADSAFCNGLLVPLGSRQASVPGLDVTVLPAPDAPDWSPLTIITTNNERDLPEAFLRRCIVLRLPAPGPDRLVEIADRYFPALPAELRSLVGDLAHQVAGASTDERPVSTAEFLDLVKVVLHLTQEGRLDDRTLETIKRVTLHKHDLYGRRDRMWST